LNTLAKMAAAIGNDAAYSTTIANALAAKAPLNSPALTGTPTAPTAALGDATTKISTTAFVQAAISDFNTAIATLLAAKAPLASPALTGEPTAPTPAAGNNTTRISTTAFVQAAISQLASAVASDLATKAPIANPVFTGSVTVPGTGANGITQGTGDGASFYTYNFALKGWYGMGLVDNSTGAVNGYYDFRNGFFNTKGGFFKDGVEVAYNNTSSYDFRSYPRRVGGGALNFNWQGQPGQPSWLWGGEDGSNMYVFKPANFSVAYAANAGLLEGRNTDGVVSTGMAARPVGGIGTYAFLWNEVSEVLNPGDTRPGSQLTYAHGNTQAAGTSPAGTWRLMGDCSTGSTTPRLSVWMRIS